MLQHNMFLLVIIFILNVDLLVNKIGHYCLTFSAADTLYVQNDLLIKDAGIFGRHKKCSALLYIECCYFTIINLIDIVYSFKQ